MRILDYFWYKLEVAVIVKKFKSSFSARVGASIRCFHRVSMTGIYKVFEVIKCTEMMWGRTL